MSVPTTGLEQRGYVSPWTTFAEEADYIDALLSEVPAIEKHVIGQGETGLDLNLFTFGNGPRSIFIKAQVHSDEVAGRDALLTCLREWSTDTSSTMSAYLEEVTMLLLPTCRPDSQTSRHNANEVNINRDHVTVSQSETRAIQGVITDYQPDVMVDVHEGRNITNDYATSKVLNPNISTGLQSLSHDLEQAVKTAVEADSFTWEPYQNHNIRGPEYAHNSGGLRHAVGILLESRRTSDNSLNVQARFDAQISALNGVLAWHQQNVQEAADAADDSREAANASKPDFEFVVSTSSSGPVVTPAPTHYRLPGGWSGDVERVRAAFNLEANESARFLEVAASVESQSLVHYLFHPESPLAVSMSTPITSLIPGEPYPGGVSDAETFMVRDGVRCPVNVRRGGED